MLKGYTHFLILVASVLLLFTNLSPSFAEIHKWKDLSKPFTENTGILARSRPVLIEVILPEKLKNYKSIPLIVRINKDPALGAYGAPFYLTLNNNDQRPYLIKKTEENYRININTDHLKKGSNILKFSGGSYSHASLGSRIVYLNFDFPNAAKINTNITKKIENEKTSKLTPVTTEKTYPIEEEPHAIGARWAVIIGVSNYQDSRIPSLRYASKDARAFFDWLISPNGGKYAPSRVKLLLDEQATENGIRTALFEWLSQALEEDIVTIYFAGHGSPQSPNKPDNLFLLPFDTKYDSVATTGFPMWDIETALKRFISAKRVIVITDACHAGGVGQSFDVARRAGRGINVVPISSNLQNLSKIGDGICIISASDDSQFSQESKKWGGGHGVFTYYLLQGLKGEADYSKDNQVSLGEIIPYLSEQVRRATKNAQTPTVAGRFDPALSIGK